MDNKIILTQLKSALEIVRSDIRELVASNGDASYCTSYNNLVDLLKLAISNIE